MVASNSRRIASLFTSCSFPFQM